MDFGKPISGCFFIGDVFVNRTYRDEYSNYYSPKLATKIGTMKLP